MELVETVVRSADMGCGNETVVRRQTLGCGTCGNCGKKCRHGLWKRNCSKEADIGLWRLHIGLYEVSCMRDTHSDRIAMMILRKTKNHTVSTFSKLNSW